MKTNGIRIHWSIPVIGIALIAVGVLAAASYLDYQRKIRLSEASRETLDHLYKAVQLSKTLKAIREGDIREVARRVEVALCEEIVAVSSRLPAASAGDRAIIHSTFARLAALRPETAELFPGVSPELPTAEIEVDRILAEARGQTQPGTERVTATSPGAALPQ